MSKVSTRLPPETKSPYDIPDVKPSKKIEAIWVSTRSAASFRRAGRVWARAPQLVPLDELSSADLAAIESEPMLRVELAEE